MPLRVAFDARDALAPDARGWGRHARELLEALRDGAGGPLALATLEGGSRVPEVVWEQVLLPRALVRLRPDVVHAPNCFLPLVRSCAGVVTVHDLAWEEFPDDFEARTRAKFAYVTPRAVRSAERVICVSAFTRDDVCSRYGVDPSRVQVVWNAPSLPVGSAPAPPWAPAGPYVIGIGDLRAKKNWGRLVTAVRRLREIGAVEHSLVIAGADAGEREALLAAAGPGGSSWLSLPGYVADAELDALLRGADCLCHPSLYEGFGLVIAEAMVRGVPVACASGTALPEAAGGAAELFDPLDADAVADALLRVVGDRAAWASLRSRGLARVEALSWTRAAEETAAVYREAAADR